MGQLTFKPDAVCGFYLQFGLCPDPGIVRRLVTMQAPCRVFPERLCGSAQAAETKHHKLAA